MLGTGLKVGLVRLLGNLVHRNEAIQNQAHALGCVPLVLNAVKLDPRQPMIREWALLATRNLCEGNDAIQEAIRALKAQQVVDTPELRKMGIKPELDASTNRVHVKQVPKKKQA